MQVRKLAPGDRILDYRILERIGEGGFGEVFRAQHEVLGRIVAIKVPRDIEALSALRLEGVIQATLDHPAIVKTLEISISHDPPYVVLEHVDGLSLAEILKREGPRPWRRATRILLEAARGLRHAHERGIVHGDVKPGNVLVEPGEDGRVRLTDFGLGRIFEGPRSNVQISRSLELAASGAEVVGTLRYLAPEVQRGEPADERADIYSWAVLLFETLTGKVPEGRELPSELAKDPLPRELDDVFERCFTRREKRPRNLDEPIAALERLLERGPGARDPESEKASSAIPYKGASGSTLVKPLVPSTEPPRKPELDETAWAIMKGDPAKGDPFAPPPMPSPVESVKVTPVEVRHPAVAPGATVETPRDFLAKLDTAPAQALLAELAARRAAKSSTVFELEEPLQAACRDEKFRRFHDDVVLRLRQRFQDIVVPAAGWELGVGVLREGEPQHRIYTTVLPWLDLGNVRRVLKQAQTVFDVEKGVWEKEVTFVLVVNDLRDRAEVLDKLRAFSTGWWRRRRVVLVEASSDRVYATELGCDIVGSPLKRRFFAGLTEDVRAARALAARARTDVVCRRRPARAWVGTMLALIASLAVIGGGVVAERASSRAMRRRHHRAELAAIAARERALVAPTTPAAASGGLGELLPFRPSERRVAAWKCPAPVVDETAPVATATTAETARPTPLKALEAEKPAEPPKVEAPKIQPEKAPEAPRTQEKPRKARFF